MGCDIHMVLERQYTEDGPWIGVLDFDYRPHTRSSPKESTYTQYAVLGRDYELFAELAGVRGDSPTALAPRGAPEDMSALCKEKIDGWGPDGHSHTYMSVTEFAEAFMRVMPDFVLNDSVKILPGANTRDAVTDALFGYWFEEDDRNMHRVVIWFDN